MNPEGGPISGEPAAAEVLYGGPSELSMGSKFPFATSGLMLSSVTMYGLRPLLAWETKSVGKAITGFAGQA